MSLEYYINHKKYCTQQIELLDKKVNTLNDQIFFFHEKKQNLMLIKKECEKKMHELCEHEFETDLIDIDPDRSIMITYCKKCEYTCK